MSNSVRLFAVDPVIHCAISYRTPRYANTKTIPVHNAVTVSLNSDLEHISWVLVITMTSLP